MSFTGKATYSAGISLPEIVEDVSDLVSIVSPAETPLLSALGDPLRVAQSTVHEWLEDSLLPNSDTLSSPVDASTALLPVTHAQRFRAGDLVRTIDGQETMLVNSVDLAGGKINVTRGYGQSSPRALSKDDELRIFGNAALEGDVADAARFTIRQRKQNYTQIFSATVEVSGSELAARQIGVADEMNYQKQLRLRELLRDLENSVINGRAVANGVGSPTGRRTMAGLIQLVTTNAMTATSLVSEGDPKLSADLLRAALKRIWEASGSSIDLILVGPAQKQQINAMTASSRQYAPADQSYRDLVNVIETDFGVSRVLLSRHVPRGTAILLDSTRVEVLPLAGRSFAFKPLAATGDRESGQLIGEYTLELRNEAAHGIISGIMD